MIGTTLSHYRITEKLGAGGMGVVYRAEDTNLDRQIAIKVLPDIFSGDPERLARFEREAKLLASLNHPNIAAIHGLEEAGGKRFLVLELVEGETLAQRIAKGPLPVDEALEVCRQIAEGLEAAHEKGIIHRDLKPANVKITPEGKVKVLDFGLAKAFHTEPSAEEISHSPTISEMTRPGVILGTAAYMSPEQARGKTVDKRADVWAFGCILFECLTGKRAFAGDSATEIMAAILRGDPDWRALPRETPKELQAILQHCLQKDPKFRIRDIADAWMEIERAVSAAPKGGTTRSPKSRGWHPATELVLLLGGVSIGLVSINYLRPNLTPLMVTSVIKLEPGRQLAAYNNLGNPTRCAMAISSDGSFIVYAAGEDKPQAQPQLYLRRSGASEAKPIAGAEGGTSPFLSPDDRYVGFSRGGKLWKIAIEGGVPVLLCDSFPFGASWGPDNAIVFSTSESSGLSKVAAEGGKPEVLTTPDPKRQEYGHRLPVCLPGGKGVLFTIMKHAWDRNPRVAALDYKTGQWNVLLEDASDAKYVPGGYLVFLRQGILMAVRFDENRMQTSGTPSPVLSNVMHAINVQNSGHNSGAGQFAISPSGTLVYASGGIWPDFQNELVWVDKKGSVTTAVAEKKYYLYARLSPDGSKIAYNVTGLNKGVWVYDISRRSHIPVSERDRGGSPVWWDNTRVVFSGSPESNNIFWRNWDRSNEIQQLTTSEYVQRPQSWHPDGKTLALGEYHLDTGHDILIFDATTGRVTPWLNSKASELFPVFSPDGRYLAYSSNETGKLEVWIKSFGGPPEKKQVSNAGGLSPIWSRDGKQLFYWQGGSIWVVDFRVDHGMAISEPRSLFRLPNGETEGAPTRSYDLSSDSQRFLMVRVEELQPRSVTEMILIQNWFEELKRLVPTGKN
jgi:serine/threonine-protein kinase